jgi:hypothetical protein
MLVVMYPRDAAAGVGAMLITFMGMISTLKNDDACLLYLITDNPHVPEINGEFFPLRVFYPFARRVREVRQEGKKDDLKILQKQEKCKECDAVYKIKGDLLNK